MVNIEMLEAEMKRQNKSDADVAKAIKKDLSTWYRRKQAPQTIQIGEIEKIKTFLNLSKTESVAIFLS